MNEGAGELSVSKTLFYVMRYPWVFFRFCDIVKDTHTITCMSAFQP